MNVELGQMPYSFRGQCSDCGYHTRWLLLDGNAVKASCAVCRDIVAARHDSYCDWDPYRCPGCATELSEGTDFVCPRCNGELIWENCHVNRRPPPVEGRVHFLRLGSEAGTGLALVRGCQLRLAGAREPGQWIGEGIARRDQIEFKRRIADWPFSSTRRLEIHLPGGAPWLAVDLAKLRQGLEAEGKLYSGVYHGWLTGQWQPVNSALAQATVALSPAEMFAMLVSVPPEAHCLEAVHDGRDWHALEEIRLVVHYSESLVYTINYPPKQRLENDYCPRRVELWRDEQKLARWIQPDMLADLRIRK